MILLTILALLPMFLMGVVGVVIGAQGERLLCKAEHSVDAAREHRSASRYTVSPN